MPSGVKAYIGCGRMPDLRISATLPTVTGSLDGKTDKPQRSTPWSIAHRAAAVSELA